MTYSIITREPSTGEIGVAVFTGSPFVGAKVPWAQAGVGAVATQARTVQEYGPAGLTLLAAGVRPRTALEKLLKDDPFPEERQLGILDRYGSVAAHTGSKAIREAGHLELDDFCVQANTMATPTVWEASAVEYERAEGSFPERLLAAMEAVEARGGDLRGARSCAMRIVSAEAFSESVDVVILDIRVDDHPAPLQEMRRLVTKYMAYEAANAAIAKAESGDIEGAFDDYASAIQLQPEELQLRIWGWLPLTLADEYGQLDRVAGL
ncbi:MAG: DUF1028 domain-containing protein, partial [Anaerolineales bacterium]